MRRRTSATAKWSEMGAGMIAFACAGGAALAIGACDGPSPYDVTPGDNGGAPTTPDGGAPAPGSGDGARADGGGGSSASGGAGGLPCDVDAVLAANCRSCHGATPSYGAPMPLVTYADLTAPAVSDPSKKVYQLVASRTHDDARPMPQPPNPRLSAADQATIDAWTGAGAPESTAGATCGATGTGGGVVVPTLGCTPDVHARAAAPFTMPSTVTDQYMCFGFDVTTTSKRQLIGFAPHIDNPKIVHHFLLFKVPNAASPTPTACSGLPAQGELVTGWAPGGGAFELPPEAGFPTDPSGTTHYVLQIHYNNVKGLVGESDQSGYDICTTDQLRPNDAAIFAFGATTQISIPPHATQDITCTTKWKQPAVHIFSSSPHMHLLGKALESTSYPQGSTTAQTLLDAPNFSFATGGGGGAISASLATGDTIKTRCMWDNTTDSQVTFGEKTSNEMCFAFMTYYPAITDPKWQWFEPSLPGVTSCAPTGP